MKLIIIDWEDVSKTTNDETFNKRTPIDKRLGKMKTVGWLYRDTEKSILLVQEFSDGTPRDHVTIPKSLIKKITEV